MKLTKFSLSFALVFSLLMMASVGLAIADEAERDIVGYWQCTTIDGSSLSSVGANMYFDFEANNNWCISTLSGGSRFNHSFGTWRWENNKFYIDYYDNGGYAHAECSVAWIDGETLDLEVLVVRDANTSTLTQGCHRLKRIEKPYGNAREDVSWPDYVGTWEAIATYTGAVSEGLSFGSPMIIFESSGEISHSLGWISFDWSNAEFTDGKLVIPQIPLYPNSTSTWYCYITDEKQLVCDVITVNFNEWINDSVTTFSTEVFNFLDE